jgi:hypothetical protein
VWELFALAVGMGGVAVRALVIGFAPRGTSGRNVEQQEASVLNVSGMYSLVRHPLYLGNFLMWLGVILVMRSWWVTVIMTLVYWLYYERIMFTEEEFLRRKFGAAYEQWSNARPAMVPRAGARWVPPAMDFSWRNVLRREYSGVCGLIASWAFAVWIDDWHAFHQPRPDAMVLVVLGIGLAQYLLLRTLKKSTSLLHVEGR